MAKITDLSNTKRKEEQVFTDLRLHYDLGFNETDRRATGRGRVGSISFNEADELFRSYINPSKWPYDAVIFDPRIFTFIFEKTARLIANKPKGRLIPREGSDIMAAKINNALLDYQWDVCNMGGSMISKWSIMDINTRKYGSAFALCKWRYECDSEGKVLFDGPDMQVLNNRDVAHDLSATSIESCNWFQVRQYVTIQELEHVNDQNREKPVYKNLKELKDAVAYDGTANGSGGDSRGTNWQSRNRAISGLETDPVGKDPAFKTVEIITEYRKDRWITFSVKHGVILRDIANPYKNNEIPIVMLRYYAIDDDLYGMSEIEPVKGPQRAINALVCQYVDEINQKLYTPIAAGPGVRQHTLNWGKGAIWIMNNPMTDFRLVESRSNAAQYFNNTYSVLVAAMMNALGESSLGISNIQPYQKDKTATEVKALQLQRNARDQFNQIFLSEAIKRQMKLWHSMNQLLLFSDPEKKAYIVRIVGDDALRYFIDQGLSDEDESSEEIKQYVDEKIFKQVAEGGEAPDEDEMNIIASSTSYKNPINVGTEEKPKYVSKLKLDKDGRSGELAIEPEDIMGQFDFTVDVQSMMVNSDDERKQARQAAVSMLATNPNILQLLATEGVKPKFKELFVSWLEDTGFTDADRFFEKAEPTQSPGMGQILSGGASTQKMPDVPQQESPNQNKPNQSTSPTPFSDIGPVSPKSLNNS